MRSSMASSNVSASPWTGTPGRMADHPPPSATTAVRDGSSWLSSRRSESAATTTKRSFPRTTVVMTPSWAASRTLRRFVRAEVKLSKCRGIDMRGPSLGEAWWLRNGVSPCDVRQVLDVLRVDHVVIVCGQSDHHGVGESRSHPRDRVPQVPGSNEAVAQGSPLLWIGGRRKWVLDACEHRCWQRTQ